ncbi:hypothetical protein D9758_015051 [Tetrapyrgos nigripes]|uniref:HTH CENPB-type domain-containing protein n=1 Tax=Tetrapyrgos nigripes TaxID=182062 RepID=A0A8H5FSF9_9AGAR|nr:hypothetical protein D9758_015051 [Tetrapyrgos nigripes]
MVGKAQSQLRKAHDASQQKASQLESTLSRRARGGRTIQEFNASKQKLTEAEERIIADHIVKLGNRAQGPTELQIEEFANHILFNKYGEKYEKVGKRWLYDFYARHPEIDTYWSKSLDTQRAGALNEHVVEHWFVYVKTNVIDVGILPEDWYGMDENNCPRGNLAKERVAGGSRKKTQHQQGGANRENVIGIVTICGDGTVLWPTLIFKGANLWTAWCKNNIANATFSASLKGWTDLELTIDWLVNHFDPQTREKAQGHTRALFMDGHSSHFTEPVIQFALANGIVVIGYPPHCTHALQGLDVVCFAKLKAQLKKAVTEFEELSRLSIHSITTQVTQYEKTGYKEID